MGFCVQEDAAPRAVVAPDRRGARQLRRPRPTATLTFGRRHRGSENGLAAHEAGYGGTRLAQETGV